MKRSTDADKPIGFELERGLLAALADLLHRERKEAVRRHTSGCARCVLGMGGLPSG